MEFSEIREKFKDLSADQVCTLAEFGRDVLNAGINTDLIPFIGDVLIADEFDVERNKYTIHALLHIAQLLSKLNEECWSERQTFLGLTGVGVLDDYYGFDGAQRIELK